MSDVLIVVLWLFACYAVAALGWFGRRMEDCDVCKAHQRFPVYIDEGDTFITADRKNLITVHTVTDAIVIYQFGDEHFKMPYLKFYETCRDCLTSGGEQIKLKKKKVTR